ncbi:hypothetical protein AA15669_0336 [Saccharibacter floricola DSM 15669]|uniref:Uncharacterized protein n=1 Tax=Saccharibacter floricola DSM 15669 TaxID=1123227 RepID=A0ABQ0NWL7_9PROT|nr:hypothetical protein AA15669_0336 [Saccharibacter floricola DSM 15669]
MSPLCGEWHATACFIWGNEQGAYGARGAYCDQAQGGELAIRSRGVDNNLVNREADMAANAFSDGYKAVMLDIVSVMIGQKRYHHGPACFFGTAKASFR